MTVNNDRILFITRHYLDDNNGGANASKGFIHVFCRIFGELNLIYPEHIGRDCSSFVPSSCRLYPCLDNRSKIRKGLDMYRGRLHRFTDFVRRHLTDQRYDIIVIDHSLTAASLIGSIHRTGARVITIHHNVERDYLKDNKPSILYRLPYGYFIRRAERDALLLSDLNLTLTKHDAKTFRCWYPDKNLKIHNAGICDYRPLGKKTFPVTDGSSRVFVITGSLCFRQSLQPILSFISVYYPLLKDICPTARLIIAGRNPGKELLSECSKDSSVRIIANPADMRDVIALADYYICPIDAGSGIKLRIMDGLRGGLPILAHDVASRGYDSIASAGCLFSYHDRESFMDSLYGLLNCKMSRESVYASFCNVFSLETKARQLSEILSKHGII